MSHSDWFQLGQNHSLVMAVVIEEHAIIYGKIGNSLFLEHLAFVGKYNGAANAIFGRFEKVGQGTVLSVVFS